MVGGSRSILTRWIACGNANQYGAHLGTDDERHLAKDARGILKGTFGLPYFLHAAFFSDGLKSIGISSIMEADPRPEGAIDFAHASCRRIDTAL